MKRKANIQSAEEQIRKEYEKIVKKMAQVEKLQNEIENIKKGNNWLNYTGEDFYNGYDWFTDEGQELLKMINAISK